MHMDTSYFLKSATNYFPNSIDFSLKSTSHIAVYMKWNVPIVISIK